ncbi:MAG: hypothetical protein ACK4SY_06690 [Pyrobaculum sp.]
MPVVDYYAVWQVMREIFHLAASLFASLGLSEWGGRVMAAWLFTAFFFLAGAFKKSRRVVGPLLAALIVLTVLLGR